MRKMRRRSGTVLLVFLVLVTASCRAAREIIYPVKSERTEITVREYDRDGVKFSYPDNWKVTDDSVLENGNRFISLEDADDSTLTISLATAGQTFDPEEFATDVVKGIRTDLELAEDAVSGGIGTSRRIGGKTREGSRYRFDRKLLGMEVPFTVDLFLLVREPEEGDAMILLQAPDQDRKAADKEFQVVLDTLRFGEGR